MKAKAKDWLAGLWGGSDAQDARYQNGPQSWGRYLSQRKALDPEKMSGAARTVREAALTVLERRPDLRSELAGLRLRWGTAADQLMSEIEAEMSAPPGSLFAMTDGGSIMLRASWFALPDAEQRSAILAHECAHAALGHPRRYNARTMRNPCVACLQRAGDLVVNRMLAAAGWSEATLRAMGAHLPQNAAELRVVETGSLEDVYRALHAAHEQDDPTPEDGGEDGNGNGAGQGEDGQPGEAGASSDGASSGGDDDDDADDDADDGYGQPAPTPGEGGQPPAMPDVRAPGEDRFEDAARDAAREMSAGGETVADFGDFVRRLPDLNARQERIAAVAAEVARWVLHRAQVGAGGISSSRPSRRLGGAPRDGVLYPFAPLPRAAVGLAVDVSGSVAHREEARDAVREVAKAIEAACESAGADVIPMRWASRPGFCASWANVTERDFTDRRYRVGASTEMSDLLRGIRAAHDGGEADIRPELADDGRELPAPDLGRMTALVVVTDGYVDSKAETAELLGPRGESEGWPARDTFLVLGGCTGQHRDYDIREELPELCAGWGLTTNEREAWLIDGAEDDQ